MKKLFVILLIAASLLIACGCEDVEGDASNTGPVSSEVEQSASKSTEIAQAFEMEHVGTSTQHDFKYFRDTTTDVLYIRYSNKAGYAGMGGLTAMLDPATGLPLTYTRYMEIYNSSISPHK